jgi:hypothetical protein
MFGSFGRFYEFVFQIDLDAEIEGMEYAEAGSDRAFLMVVLQ